MSTPMDGESRETLSRDGAGRSASDTRATRDDTAPDARPRSRPRKPRPTFEDGSLTRIFKFPSKSYPKSSYYVTADEIIIRIRKARKRWKLIIPKKRVVSYRTNRWFAKPRWVEIELTVTQATRLGLVARIGGMTTGEQAAGTGPIPDAPEPQDNGALARDAAAGAEADTASADEAVLELDQDGDDSEAPAGGEAAATSAPIAEEPHPAETEAATEAAGLDVQSSDPAVGLAATGDIEPQTPDRSTSSDVIPAFIAGTQSSTATGVAMCCTMGPGDKPRDDMGRGHSSPISDDAGQPPLSPAPRMVAWPKSDRLRQPRSYALLTLLMLVVAGATVVWMAGDADGPATVAELPAAPRPDVVAAVTPPVETGSIAGPVAKSEPAVAAQPPVEAAPEAVVLPLLPEPGGAPDVAEIERRPQIVEGVAAESAALALPEPALTPAPEQPSPTAPPPAPVSVFPPPPPVPQLPVQCRTLSAAAAAVSIHFAYASASLDPAALAALAAIVDGVRGCAEAAVVIEGHADADGDAERNQAISVRRAQAVRERLIQAGARPEQLSVIGYGASRPLAPNVSPENKHRNRRAVLLIELPD